MPTAFITRDLAPDSDFRRILTERGWQVWGQSLVTLTPLPFGSVPLCDWIFFSSQNAVRWFFEQAAQLPDWSAARAEAIRWAAIGEATERVLMKYVERVDFVGTGEPHETARRFALPSPTGGAGGGVVLLPAALHSEKTLFTALSLDFQCVQLPVYDNRPAPDPPMCTDDVLVFTSPMNVRAYFGRHVLQEKQRVVAIGSTTAAALKSYGALNPTIAQSTTESSLAEAVANWGGNSLKPD